MQYFKKIFFSIYRQNYTQIFVHCHGFAIIKHKKHSPRLCFCGITLSSVLPSSFSVLGIVHIFLSRIRKNSYQCGAIQHYCDMYGLDANLSKAPLCKGSCQRSWLRDCFAFFQPLRVCFANPPPLTQGRLFVFVIFRHYSIAMHKV